MPLARAAPFSLRAPSGLASEASITTAGGFGPRNALSTCSCPEREIASAARETQKRERARDQALFGERGEIVAGA